MSDSRLEKFIYAICSMDVSDLPVPLSRIEKLWNCLITGETPDFEPLSRNEKYLMAMLDRYDISNLPAPISRGEKLLYKIAVGETDLSDVPGYLSLYEELLKYLIENGGIGFEYVLYTFNQSLYTLYTTAEKPVKSAILKGNTESIIDRFECGSYNNNFEKVRSDDTRIRIINPITNITNFSITLNDGFQILCLIKKNDGTVISSGWIANANPTLKITDQLAFVIRKRDNSSIICEEVIQAVNSTSYKNLTELKSVKMPVLTTTGKNLFDFQNAQWLKGHNFNPTFGNTNNIVIENMSLKLSNPSSCVGTVVSGLKPNTDYYVSAKITNTSTMTIHTALGYVDNESTPGGVNRIRTTNSNGELAISIGVYNANTNGGYVLVENIQVEEGSVATSYEPYKTNILTVNEDVTLRGIGDVKDELNCLTGELTQRIGYADINSFVAPPSYRALSDNQGYMAVIGLENKKQHTNLVANLVKVSPFNNADFGMYNNPANIVVFRKNCSLDELKSIINQIQIVYELETPVVKTVDLTTVDQDGQPTKLKTFNDITHVEIKADNLIPSVDVEVATKISETLSTMGPQQLDISETQNKLGQTIDEQSENTDAAMIATTEIYEQTL